MCVCVGGGGGVDPLKKKKGGGVQIACKFANVYLMEGPTYHCSKI